MRARLLVGLAFVAVAAGGAAAFVWRDESDATDRHYRGSGVPEGAMLPSFSLRSYTGELVRSESLRGKVVLVTFLESKCKEACPVIAAEIAQGLALLAADERRGVAAIAVSTHPEDDTPANVRQFVRRHRLGGRLDYLIGSESELRPVWRKFHILSALESGDADTHSAPVRVFDRTGMWATTLHPNLDLTPANLVHDIRTALRSEPG